MRYELRHSSTLNPFVELYGDGDEEQTDLEWTLVDLHTGEVVARWDGWVDHLGSRSGTQAVELRDGAVIVDGAPVAIADLVAENLARREAHVLGLALSADGAWLAVTTAAGRIALVETRGLRVARRHAAPAGAGALAFAPDGGSLAVAGASCASLVSVADGSCRWQTPLASWTAGALTFSADGRTLAARDGYPYRLTLLAAADGRQLAQARMADAGFGFSADAEEVVYRAAGGAVVARSVATGATREVLARLAGDTRLLACVPAHDRLLLRDWDHAALTTVNGRVLARFDGKVTGACASRDGATLVAAFEAPRNAGQVYGSDHLKVIDLPTGRERARFDALMTEPVAVGGRRLWKRGFGDSLCFHDLADGQLRTVFL